MEILLIIGLMFGALVLWDNILIKYGTTYIRKEQEGKQEKKVSSKYAIELRDKACRQELRYLLDLIVEKKKVEHYTANARDISKILFNSEHWVNVERNKYRRSTRLYQITISIDSLGDKIELKRTNFRLK